MLKRALIGCLVVPAAGLVGASAPSGAALAHKATGLGSFEFLDGGGGTVDFSIDADPLPRGSLLCAAEHHHEMYPDIIIELEFIKRANFKDNTVEFSGRGLYNKDESVNIKVVAVDAVGTGAPDTLTVTVTSLTGAKVFEADGEVTKGDIFVGAPE